MPRRIVVDYEKFSELCPNPKATADNAPEELRAAAQAAKLRDATDNDVERGKANSGWGYLGFLTHEDGGTRVLVLEEDGSLVTSGSTVDLPPIAEAASCC